MWKKSKKPVRLEKKMSLKEKIQNWINRHYGTLVFIGLVIAMILFVLFCLKFVPGTESGVYYNNRSVIYVYRFTNGWSRFMSMFIFR